MTDISFINTDDFMSVIVCFLSLGLVSWFMGFGISLVCRTFIKILRKGV